MTYFDFHIQFIGIEFRHPHATHPITKAEAYECYKKGTFNRLQQRTKPGWSGGKLYDRRLYDRYLANVFFGR